MARTTDTERGARLAYDLAVQALAGLPLFPGLVLTDELARIWMDIQFAALDTMDECRLAREALRG